MKIKSILIISLIVFSNMFFAVPKALAATFNCIWTDSSGIDNSFSTATNWSGCNNAAPGASPSNVYNLIFPASASGLNPVDDIASLTVGTISFTQTFSGVGYQIFNANSNNTITINGGITDTSNGTTAGNEIDGNLILGASQAFSASSSSNLILGDSSGTLNIGSNTLNLANTTINSSVSGAGTLVVNDSVYPADVNGVDFTNANPGFTGGVTVTTGALFVDNSSSLSNASAVVVQSGALIKGNGSAGNLSVNSGGTLAPGHSPGCISTSNGTATGTFNVQIGGTTACSSYDQLQVSGSINLTSGTLQISFINGFTPSIGQSFTIINNSGSNTVTGTFSGLTEGSTTTVGGVTFRISYVGGDGNDVVLTAVEPTSSSSSSNTPKSPNTGLAAVIINPLVELSISVFLFIILFYLALNLNKFNSR